MSFKKKLLKNILTAGGYNYGTQGVYFLSTIVLSRLLLPAEFGFVTLITVFINFISIFSDAGITHAIIRSDYGTTYHKALMNLTLWIGVGLFLSMLLLAYPIALFYQNMELIPATIVLSSLFIFRALAIVPTAVLTKNLKFNILGRFTLLIGLSNAIQTIVLAYLNFSYWAIILPQIINSIIHFFLLKSKTDFKFKIYSFAYVKSALNKSKSLIGNVTGFNLINYWAGSSDALLVGKLYGEGDLGLYNRAYSLMTMALNLIGGIFNIVLYPSFKELKSNGGDILKEYAHVLNIISLITLPLGVILILFPEPLVLFLWGKNWEPVSLFLPYFGLLIMSKPLMSANTNIYILLGKERLNIKLGLVSAIIMVVSIIVGAFISLTFVSILHAAAYLSLVIPLNIYFGFYKGMGFSPSFILSFWIPKVFIMVLLIITIFLNQTLLSSILLAIFLTHALYIQRKDIKNLIANFKLKYSV